MTARRWLLLLAVLVLALSMTMAQPQARADAEPPVLIDMTPGPGETIENRTPVISASFVDPDGINVSSVKVMVNTYVVTEFEEVTTVNETGFEYRTPSILALKDGNHTVSVEVADNAGNVLVQNWTFVVGDQPEPPLVTAEQLQQILIYVMIGLGLGVAAYALYIFYLRKTKRFTYKKYFARKPVKRTYLVLYLPLGLALLIFLFGSLYIGSNPQGFGPYAYDYLIVTALVVGLMPYGIESQRVRKRVHEYERAFSQFLFELADAIRGGIDPAKAIIEFSKVDKTLMRKHLRIAADGILIGRPFEEMLEVMVKPMGSDLVKRYSSLIGEASKIGGDIAVVIHRAAQDLDELVKIEAERRRQLSVQATTIYIAFSVMMIIVLQLVTTFSALGGVSISMTGGASEPVEGGSSVEDLKQRFYMVALILGLSCGLLIGALTDGKVRMGLVHSLVMAIVATVFFGLMIF